MRKLSDWPVLGLGIFLSLVAVAEGLYVLFISNPLGSVWVAGLVTSLPFTLGIVYMGARWPDNFTSTSRSNRVTGWCFGGLGVFLIVNIFIMVTMPPDSTLQLISWGRWAATLGAGVGLLVGIFEARSIERAVRAERERVRAEEANKEQEILEYLNTLLRHEVLNTTQIIFGRAELVSTEYDGNKQICDRMGEIASNCQQLESVIKDVRLLLQASKSQLELETTNIVNLLTQEIETLRSSHEAVSVDTSLPEHAMAKANEPLQRAFANLLWNAVEHNDSETPQIEVTVRREPNTVVIQIADNGPGIPTEDRDTIFQQESRFDGNHGLGLALTHTLVNNYNGTIELTDTGPNGTLFTLTLQRASESIPSQADSDAQFASSQT